MPKKAKLSPSLLKKRLSSKKKEVSKKDISKTDYSESDYHRITKKLSTPQISDAMQAVTGTTGVIPDLISANGKKLQGTVVTVKTSDDDWGTSVKAIDVANEGEVLFIVTEGEDYAVWGELTSITASKKGIAGAVIYGACRDLDSLQEMDFPVFSKKILPNAGKPLLEGEINIQLDFNGFNVNPGDYIVGDECGIVIIPQNVLDEVFNKAQKIKSRERLIKDQIQSGKSLLDILKID